MWSLQSVSQSILALKSVTARRLAHSGFSRSFSLALPIKESLYLVGCLTTNSVDYQVHRAASEAVLCNVTQPSVTVTRYRLRASNPRITS